MGTVTYFLKKIGDCPHFRTHFNGPGRIRTYDQWIMSPRRSLCFQGFTSPLGVILGAFHASSRAARLAFYLPFFVRFCQRRQALNSRRFLTAQPVGVNVHRQADRAVSQNCLRDLRVDSGSCQQRARCVSQTVKVNSLAGYLRVGNIGPEHSRHLPLFRKAKDFRLWSLVCQHRF